jgi:UDP-N-acetylmuramate-alanine ligase
MNKSDHIHLVGVAGVGMNPLAQALLAAGYSVSGSDRFLDQGQDLDVLPKLERAGVRLVPQDGSGITSATVSVGISTAIEKDNPDLLAAQRLRIPIRHRSELLADLARDRTCVAIAGTCGKTTTTGIVGWLLEAVGADPTVVNGGILLNWKSPDRIGNVRVGKGPLWVIEADESDRSLLNFNPDWALVTNMSADHFSLDETRTLFARFLKQVRRGYIGGTESGLPPDFAPRLKARSSEFRYGGQDFTVPLPGFHNAANAFQSVQLCEKMGYGLPALAQALTRFKGIHRRLEQVGQGAVDVYDDYAHNPAKMAAAWQTLAPHYRRVVAVWRPHGFTPLANMMNDLEDTFVRVCRAQDRLYLLPVYYAGGSADRRRDSDELVERLRQRGVSAEWAADYGPLEDRIRADRQAGDTILIMGARDPELPVCARRMAAWPGL